MRVIHLCFSLHQSFGLQKNPTESEEQGYFEGKAAFLKDNAEVYQPLFAFLERTTQKYKGFRFSLVISGSWLELAERYDAKLIERLQKLVKLGQVELVAEPYYHSLTFFYDRDELELQVKQYREKIQKLFGVEGRILALPEMIYNDQVGKWAEEFGFAGMLVGGNPAILGWHSPNHVYEAMECRYLRLLFQNTMLATAIAGADSELLVEKLVSEDSEAKKLVLSVQKFQKRLELEMLRGNLVNLYLDAEVFRAQRERGIIAFFDELVATWLEVRGNHFVGAAQACVVETPSMALSVKETVSWREEPIETDVTAPEGTGIVLQSEVEMLPPKWLSQPWQAEQSKALYGLRREILATEDEKIVEDWRKLTAVDYLQGEPKATQESMQAVLADLKARAEKVKKAQAVEISRAYTKKRDRGNIDVRPVVDNTVIKVNFGAKRTGGTASQAVHAVQETADEVVPVQRLHLQESVLEAEVEVQPVEAKQQTVTEKPRGIRKVIRKLVIE